MRMISISGIEFATADQALQHVHASGRGTALRVGGKALVVESEEAERLEAAGVRFAYRCEHHDGRILTVPVH